MPYLTPPNVPEERDCRALLIPASTDWLALFGGALTELSLRWNWEQEGITVDQALAVVAEVLNGFYAGCGESGCNIPGGGHVVRLNPDTGEIEELINGDWVEPQGDYALPPTPAREEPTPEERRCLAAANAENALHLLYESLADSWGEALSLQDAINAMMAVLIGIVGTAFGLPVAALIAVFVILMSVVYETIEFVTADLWDEDFSNVLRCYLYECALDNAGVVHFDYQCVINKIGAGVTFDWTTENQVRLLLQVSYLLNVLGSQTIDAAGAATAIVSADCDTCSNDWCFTFDMTLVDADGVGYSTNGCTAAWLSGLGWYAEKGGGCAPLNGQSVLSAVNISFPSTFIRKVVVVGTSFGRTTGSVFAVCFPAINRGGTPAVTVSNDGNGEPVGVELVVNGALTGITAEFQNGAPSPSTQADGTAVVRQVTFYGSGECPFGEPNCVG